MSRSIQLLDVVALLKGCPDVGLLRGHMGTIVEVYEPGAWSI